MFQNSLNGLMIDGQQQLSKTLENIAYLILMRSICHAPVHLTISTRTGCHLSKQGGSEYNSKILNGHRVLRFEL